MAQFFLVRHGQASFGAANYDKLSPLGHQQARWLGEYYREREITFDALITGDMVRHVETGQGILDGLGTSLAADIQPGLNECDMHSVVDIYLEHYPAEKPTEPAPPAVFFRLLKKAMREWREDRLSGPLPESWPEFRERVANVMTHIRTEYADRDRVLIVSSGGAISMWLRHLLHTADQTVAELNMQIRNSSVTEGFFNSRVYRLSAFNQTPHLDRADRRNAITYS